MCSLVISARGDLEEESGGEGPWVRVCMDMKVKSIESSAEESIARVVEMLRVGVSRLMGEEEGGVGGDIYTD